MAKKLIRVSLVNFQTLGALAGYGEGYTHDEAVEDALERARRTDPDAYYDQQTDTVMFAGGHNC